MQFSYFTEKSCVNFEKNPFLMFLDYKKKLLNTFTSFSNFGSVILNHLEHIILYNKQMNNLKHIFKLNILTIVWKFTRTHILFLEK